jgi:hypothetical protein
MHPLLFKLLVLIPLLALLGILTYKKINESFENPTSNLENNLDDAIATTIPNTTTTPQTTTPAALISSQLTTGIAIKLGISIRRITNLSYSGDINSQRLAVSFTVLDPNLIEASKNELSALEVAKNANTLFTQGQFIVPIDGVNIRLEKMNQNSTRTGMNAGINAGSIGRITSADSMNANSSNLMNDIGLIAPVMDPASYFNNQGLLDSAKYARQVYDTVPVDSAATRFFTLQPDSNFNLMPVLSPADDFTKK